MSNKNNINLGNLTFATFNVNGASTHEKQKDIFDFLRRKKLDIVFLQETHCKTESENLIRSIWGYNCFICGQSNARKGVAVLFRNSFTYKIHNIYKDNEEGSFLVLDITIFNERFTLANIYGPSEGDRPEFFAKIFDLIETIGNAQILLGGDWNVILNPFLDTRNYRNLNNRQRSRKLILEKMDSLNLIDVFRTVYPDKKLYTWRRFHTTQQSRLDYFLISDSLTIKVVDIDIKPGYRSDHSLVHISLKNENIQEKIKSYWKFNNSLLHDKNYVDMINDHISKVKKQYAIPIYNQEIIETINNLDIQFTINDQLFFEMLLLEIRGKTISYASFKKREDEKNEKILNKEIVELENKKDLTQDLVNTLEEKKLALQEMRDKKTKGMIVRSRLQWLQNGEKPSRYFCNLENRNFASKRMCFLVNDKGDTLFEQDEILEETHNFYKNLYERRETEDVNINNLLNNHSGLSDLEQESLEGEITYEEAAQTLKRMKNNKSPGNSGYTVEFFKFFFSRIGHFLVRSLNHGFHVGKLSVTQRQGVITCIPKEGKNNQLLSNWRPISLLNVSYKIASACLTNRVKSVLDKLVNKNQKGFLPNRYINENLSLMYDILSYTESEQIPGMLLLVDFHKAFDSISWTFIDKVLDFFKFGPDFKKWVKTFYNEISSCVSVNGKYSQYFNMGRGVRQGDPLSPYLFLLCAEVLTRMLCENRLIKGLKIKDKEAFLSQFADDTAIFLDGSKESFCQCIDNLSTFANMSGLSINYTKTIVVWLGSKKNSNERFMRDRNFLWDPGGPDETTFKYLGIKFSTNINKIVDLNFENKINEIEKLLKVWSQRSLTPYGKITVIKTLAISKLTYLLTNLPDPGREFLKRIDNLFFKFLWDQKPNKISKTQMFLDREDGGFKMVNIFDFVATLKIGWFKKIMANEDMKSMAFSMYPMLSKLHAVGNAYMTTVISNLPNKLWIDMIKHVKRITNKNPESFEDFVLEFIFFNDNIRINNEIVNYNNFIQNHVTQIYHLLDTNSNFLTYDSFMVKYPNIQTNFLQLHGLIQSIKSYMNKQQIHQKQIFVNVQEPVGWQTLRGDKYSIKREILHKPMEHKSVEKWNNQYTNLNWKKIYNKVYKTSVDVKLRWFQMRLLYRILPTNRLLYIKHIKDNGFCNFCNVEEQNLDHLFWDCPFVELFWKYLYTNFVEKLPHAQALKFSKELIIFGIQNNVVTDKPMDLFILCAKYHIYSYKMSDRVPDAYIFLKSFKIRYSLEKFYHTNNNCEHNFDQLWAPYKPIIENL